MIWIVAFALLFVLELAYFRLAVNYLIIDKPNSRSSHSYITIRGGGVIFVLGFLAWQVMAGFTQPLSLIAVLLMATISFWDDIRSLPNGTRMGTQLLGTLLIFSELQLLQTMPIGFLLLFLVLIIGTINAYNFMDGINGITGLYSLLVLASLAWLNVEKQFLAPEFFSWMIMALVVFLIFNFRKRAKCFAGDVGSISMAVILIFALIQLIIATNNFSYILFLAVYGVDSVLTILQRLKRGENIFEAHRLHLYQLLVNQRELPHRWVAVAYMLVQLVVNCIVVFLLPINWPWYLAYFVVLLPLVIFYLWLKNQLIKRYNL